MLSYFRQVRFYGSVLLFKIETSLFTKILLRTIRPITMLENVRSNTTHLHVSVQRGHIR